MNSITSIATSGLQAAQARLNVSAHNVANVQTSGFKPQQVQATAQPQGGVQVSTSTSPQEGVNLESEVVDQILARHAFSANVQVVKTADRAMGSLLDVKA